MTIFSVLILCWHQSTVRNVVQNIIIPNRRDVTAVELYALFIPRTFNTHAVAQPFHTIQKRKNVAIWKFIHLKTRAETQKRLFVVVEKAIFLMRRNAVMVSNVRYISFILKTQERLRKDSRKCIWYSYLHELFFP